MTYAKEQQNQIRQNMLNQRNHLTASAQQTASSQLCQIIQSSSFFMNHQRFGIYHAINNEISLGPLIELIWESDKMCALPAFHPHLDNTLCFLPYTQTTELIQGPMHTQTPPYCPKNSIAPWELDVVFVPLVAFDAHKNRIGYGKGCYDRSFGFRRTTTKPLLIGCAYHFQQSNPIDSNPWDIALDQVVTEIKVI